MNFLHKLLLITGISLVSLSSAQASYQTYIDAAQFSAAVKDAKTDHFDVDGLLTNAQAKAASTASIGYVSTAFPDWNIVNGGFLCWGCNGSGYMDLSDTNLGTKGGVYGFMTTILFNTNNNAYVTFANGATLDVALGRNGLFAITSADLIAKVEFAAARNQVGYDNIGFASVTVANSNSTSNAVPEPASIALLGLGIAGIAGLRRRQPA